MSGKDGRNSAPVLIVPACGEGRGGGHLSRSFFLLRKLREQDRDAYLWIPEAVKDDVVRRFPEFFRIIDNRLNNDRREDDIQSGILSRREELAARSWDFIVLDNYRTSREDFALWAALPGYGHVPLIGIDEGGPCRNCFDFLIDLLPGPYKTEPNLCAPALLPLPKNRRLANVCKDTAEGDTSPGNQPLRVLISFGAEDSAGLGLSAARILSSHSSFEITLIVPNRDSAGEIRRELPGIRIMGKIPELREHLAEYDLFVTHFGLGAFEAVYAGVPVLLLSPTAYHERLARNAGFVTICAKNLSLINFTTNHTNQHKQKKDMIQQVRGRTVGTVRVVRGKKS